MNSKIKTFFLIGTPRSSGDKGRETFYEKCFILDAQEDRETEYISFENSDSRALSWKIMEKAKTFICACLNNARPGTIYFGVANKENSSQHDHGEILGLDVENIKDDIIKAFQFVLDSQISSDQEGLLRKGGDQNCVTIHFVPVKIERMRSKLYVIEIDVVRDWLLCKDKVYFCKCWLETPRQGTEEKGDKRKDLSNFFRVKELWDDVVTRYNGELRHVKPVDVHNIVRLPLREWYSKKGPEAQHGMYILWILAVQTLLPAINGCKGKTSGKKKGYEKNIKAFMKCNGEVTMLDQAKYLIIIFVKFARPELNA